MAAAVAPPLAVASSQRLEPGSVNIHVTDFSKVKSVKPDEIEKATQEWVDSFNKTLKSGSFENLKSLFVETSYWRDHHCLSWDARKFFFKSTR